MSQSGEKKRVERRKTIEFGESTKWNGDKRTVHIFKEQLKRNLIKAKIDVKFQIKERPDASIDMLERYNGGDMDLAELILEGGIPAVNMWQKQEEVYEKNMKEAQEQGNMALNIFENMVGGEVKSYTKAVRERGEGIAVLSDVSLMRMRKVIEIVDARYGQEDMATRMKVQTEIEAIGHCENHQDVQTLIEVLEEYQEELEQIAGMRKMTDIDMVHHFTKRLPKNEAFYTQMVETIAAIKIVDIKWEEVVEMRKSKMAVIQMIGGSMGDETEIKSVNMMREESKKEQWRGASGRGGNGYGNARGRSDHRNQGRGYHFKSTGACHAWTFNQKCRFGDECRFEHIKPDNTKTKENEKGHKKGGYRVNLTRQQGQESDDEDEKEGDSGDDESETRKRKVLETMISKAQEELIQMKKVSPKKHKTA